MLFSVFGEEYAVFCTFKKSRAGWLVMQGISRRLARYAGDLAQAGSSCRVSRAGWLIMQGISLHRVSSQTISKGGGKGKQQKTH